MRLLLYKPFIVLLGRWGFSYFPKSLGKEYTLVKENY